jgi:hypothetical protein
MVASSLERMIDKRQNHPICVIDFLDFLIEVALVFWEPPISISEKIRLY